MKRIIGVCVFSLLWAVQMAGANGLGVFGAYWDSKDADDTIGGGATVRLALSPEIMIEFAGAYFEFDDEEEGVKGTLEVIPLEVGLLVKFIDDGAFSLYAGGGGGYYLMDSEFSGFGETVSFDIDDEFGYYVTGGMSFRLGPSVSLFGEVRHTWLKAKSGTAKMAGEEVDLDVDIKLTGIGARAGLMLRW